MNKPLGFLSFLYVVLIFLVSFVSKNCAKCIHNFGTFSCTGNPARSKNSPVVWLSPILPFINDTEENLHGLLNYCIKAKVRGILCFGFGVTLREGNREYFYAKLDEQIPGLKQKYVQQFSNAYTCDSPNSEQLMNIFQSKCQQQGILIKVNRSYKL